MIIHTYVFLHIDRLWDLECLSSIENDRRAALKMHIGSILVVFAIDKVKASNTLAFDILS